MHEQLLLHHLQQLVELYPKSEDQDSVRVALRYCQAVLRKSHNFEDVLLHKQNGYSSLTASTRGTKTPKLLLQAHIDVVPASEPPQLVVDQKQSMVSGRGAYDMLFATACYLTFVEEHQADLATLDIGLMLTGDEELCGLDGAAYLLEQGYGAGICFLPDAGNGFGDLSTASKGGYSFDLVARGKAHHGSRPWEGDGAANKLVRILHELLQEFDPSDQANSTMTVTRLQCGDANNQGPNKATAHLDIRYKDAADFERIQMLLTDLCTRETAETQHIQVIDSFHQDPDHPAVQAFLKMYAKHNQAPITLSKAHGGSDARFFAAKGIPVLMLRPDGSGAHADHETLSTSSLTQFYLLMEDYILTTAKVA